MRYPRRDEPALAEDRARPSFGANQAVCLWGRAAPPGELAREHLLDRKLADPTPASLGPAPGCCYGTLPRFTTHSTGCPVTRAIESKSLS